ncbi:hypothetical protein C0995_011100 [Termitomyces sp. Mi166|nr:hypothetical protein C0995_011100 [Termitomyces sp. Mi166\
MSTSSLAKSSAKAPAPKKQARIKRPPNAWVLYRSDKQKEIQEKNPSRKFKLGEMSGIISELWAEESEVVIRKYELLANKKLLEHRKAHPNYKYQPGPPKCTGKQKKPRKVRARRVTKKEKTLSTSAINPTHIQATNADSDAGEWPEVNGQAPASDNVVEIGSAVAPNDQYTFANPYHTFYDHNIVSPDNFDVETFDYGARPMAYQAQPYAGSTQTAMQSFVASQANAYQPTAALGGQVPQGYTRVYYDQSYAGGWLGPSNTYGTNTRYQQTTEFDVAAQNDAFPTFEQELFGVWATAGSVMA